MNIHNLLKETGPSNEITQIIISTITDINKLDPDSNTYLHIAISHGHGFDTISKIIEIGCDYNLKNNNGLTMFELYFERGNIQILDQIVMLMIKLNIEFTNIMFVHYCCMLSKMNPDKNICKLIIEKNSHKLDPINIFDNVLIFVESSNQKLLFDLITIFNELTYDKSIIFEKILQKYLFSVDLNIIDYFVLRETSTNCHLIKILLSECNIDDPSQTNFVQKILNTNYQLTLDEIMSYSEIIMAIDTKSNKKTLLKYWNDSEYTKYLLYVAIIDKNKHLFKNINDQNKNSIVIFLSKVVKNLNAKDIFCSGYFILATIRKFFKFVIFDNKCPVRISYLLFKSRIKSLERTNEIEKLKKENTYYKLHVENSPDSNLVKKYCEHFNSMIVK